MIRLKRVYEPAASDDDARFLVERLWPRGIRKADLKMDAWVKDAAPSTELRQWFGHDPAKWEEFRRRYRAELRRSGQVEILHELAKQARSESITLVYSAADQEHNQARVLKEFLEEQQARRRSR